MKTKIQFIALILALTLICAAFASCVPTPDITTTTTTTTTQKPDTPPDEPHIHTEVVDEAVLPTCTSTGLTEGKHCSDCGEVLVPQNEVHVISHTYDSKIDSECNACGYIRDLNCTHLNIETIPGIAPTCTSKGITDGKRCMDCEDFLILQTELDMTEHEYDNFNDEYCNICGEKREYKDSLGLIYEENEDGTYTVKGIGTCTESYISIPKYHNGKLVTKIGNSAFHMYSANGIIGMHLPDSILEIGIDSFWCSGITFINIPDSIISVDGSAFEGCFNLKFTEYSNVRYLGNSDNPYLLLVEAQNQSISFTGIHPDTKVITDSAFSGCSALYEITIPSKITRISNRAFQNCSSLEKLIIDGTIESIGSYAFDNCTSLSEIEIKSTIARIENHAFYNCNSLKEINLHDKLEYLGDNAFGYCSSLTQFICGDDIKYIGNSSFIGCSSLISFDGGKNVEHIGDSAFSDCTSLSEINLGSTTYIGDNAFIFCKNLKDISIPQTVKHIGAHAFGGSGIEHILFFGTKSQWLEIDFGDYWNGGHEIRYDDYYSRICPAIPATEVTCSDGTVKIK